MRTEFLRKFDKDLDKVRDQDIKTRLMDLILTVEAAKAIAEIPNLKKLKGHANAFRIRLGDYRVGIFLSDNDTVEFARFLQRKDIYKVFP